MSWQSLILVPGLIAAGAGLLFGINAFTLDLSGSVWLSTLPGWTVAAFRSKSLVFFEIALVAVSSALVGGSLRAPDPSTVAEVTAAVASAVACAMLVVALGMRSSLKHPHRADMQGSRDTPAPPGVMAAQSIRFATVTTFTSLYFVFLGPSRGVVAPPPRRATDRDCCVAVLEPHARGMDASARPRFRGHDRFRWLETTSH